MKRILALASGLVLLAAANGAAAQGPHIVRGVVASLDGVQLTVTEKNGKTETVTLGANWSVAVLKPIPVSAIQPGSFIGTTEMPQADGTGVSVEVHVFPPGVKMGEGHYAWDLEPGAMMTNGTVGTVTAVTKGEALDVSYPGGTRHVVVPPNVPIVLITPGGDRALVHAGVPVFLVAVPGADGKLAANAVSVGENGAPPPM